MTFREWFEYKKDYTTHYIYDNRDYTLFIENLNELGCTRIDDFDKNKLTNNTLVELIYGSCEVVNSTRVDLDDDVEEVAWDMIMEV